MRIASVVGARPNFIKLAPVHKALAKDPEIEHTVIHTGQHYDFEMSEIFFRVQAPGAGHQPEGWVQHPGMPDGGDDKEDRKSALAFEF